MKKNIYFILFTLYFVQCLTTNINHKTDSKINSEIKIVNAKSGLNVRELPSVDSRKLITIPNRTEIIIQLDDFKWDTIDGLKGNWIKTTYEGKTGWIFEGFLLDLDRNKVIPTTHIPYFYSEPSFYSEKKIQSMPSDSIVILEKVVSNDQNMSLSKNWLKVRKTDNWNVTKGIGYIHESQIKISSKVEKKSPYSFRIVNKTKNTAFTFTADSKIISQDKLERYMSFFDESTEYCIDSYFALTRHCLNWNSSNRRYCEDNPQVSNTIVLESLNKTMEDLLKKKESLSKLNVENELLEIKNSCDKYVGFAAIYHKRLYEAFEKKDFSLLSLADDNNNPIQGLTKYEKDFLTDQFNKVEFIESYLRNIEYKFYKLHNSTINQRLWETFLNKNLIDVNVDYVN
jgi:uncharacterized protein YgiM (DUF1202 family)